jgi:hypothetical protein
MELKRAMELKELRSGDSRKIEPLKRKMTANISQRGQSMILEDRKIGRYKKKTHDIN